MPPFLHGGPSDCNTSNKATLTPIRLAVSTVLVAICAEFLVDSIDGMVAGTGISLTFVGLILVPIVGNAAEVLISPPFLKTDLWFSTLLLSL